MRGGGAVALIVLLLGAAAGASVDISADQSTSWSTPPHVNRCPLHKAFQISKNDAGVSLIPPGGGKFSVAMKEIPVAAKGMLSASTGLILRYTSPPGASALSLWRIRVNGATDHAVRFVDLFSVPANGVVNETRYFPWTSFFGQIMERVNPKVLDCREITDPRCTMKPEDLTHVSLLESEDTAAHEIVVHSLILTTDPITEQNPAQHHTEEAEALMWEREHRAMNVQNFEFNGTHYVIGGNCTGVCTAKYHAGSNLSMGVAAGAPVEASRYLWAVVITVLGRALCGH